MRGNYAIFAIVGIAMATVACASPEMLRTRALAIGHVELGALADGNYTGEYSYGSYTYVVSVEMSGGRIVAAKAAKNRDTPHAKKAEGVFEEMLEEQRTDVDAVSGATTTSKALLKAAENALERKGA